MAGSAFGPLGTGIGAGLGGLLGLFSGNQGPTSVSVPGDLAGARQSQINTLQQLLGGSGPGGALAGISNAFGNLGVPQSPLQTQTVQGISQYLNQPNPAQQALNTALPSLQEILTPGTMNPQFAQDLSMANQQGARFGSANAIMRGQAFTSLFNQRNQAAQTLGMLGQNANTANMGNLLGAFGAGTQQAQQGDVGLQRLLSLYGGLLGLRQQATMGLPINQQPSLGQQIGIAGMQGGFLMNLLKRNDPGTKGQTNNDPFDLNSIFGGGAGTGTVGDALPDA